MASASESLEEMLEAMQDAPELGQQVLAQMDFQAQEEFLRAWEASKGAAAPEVEWWQLRRLALLNGMPMIGFGFMDNAIMIVAGDYIDSALCFHLSLSTMFAASVGNTISDLAGIATAGPIEMALRNLGIQGHDLTASQLRQGSVMIWKYIGSAIGIVLGCVIGMCPLLLPEDYRLWPSREQLERQASAELDIIDPAG